MRYVERARSFWRAHTWEIIIAATVLLVAFLSYGLGYLSAQGSARTPIIIETKTAQ